MVVFVSLFTRQVKIDAKKDKEKFLEQDRLGNLHMLKELKKFYDGKGLDSGIFDKEIRDLEDKVK